MSSKVYIAGTGIRKFGRFPDMSHSDFAWPVVRQALLESGLPKERLEVAYASSVFGGMLVGQQILGKLGITGLPIINVENACSSSAVGVREAAQRIASGQCEAALVLGVEMLSKLGRGPLPLNADDWDVSNGVTMPTIYAMRAQRYAYEHGMDPKALSEVTVKARRHGALNPLAQFQKTVEIDEVNASREIADPLRLLHCCPTGDGAAAVVLVSERLAKTLDGVQAIEVAAAELRSGFYEPGPVSMIRSHASERTAAQAFATAGIEPKDIDVAELHDSFAIAELMYYEAFGLCAHGDALALLRSGATSLGGPHVVNPSGGLMSRGHPVAASGVAQIVEITRQLQGRSGAHQVQGARVGVTHVTGGGISGFEHGACAVTVLKR
jgi:benzoylsuccinyl-CoA thiolase BbsB subunit